MLTILLSNWFVTIGLVTSLSMPTPAQNYQVAEYLRNRIEAAGVPPRIAVGNELVYASRVLPAFYQRRLYQAAWSNDRGALPHATDLLQAIRRAVQEGLDPSVYHLDKINELVSEVRSNMQMQRRLEPRRLVDLDLLLTDAFLIYASHLLSGRVDPLTFDSEWHVTTSKEVDIQAVLEKALDTGRISEALESLKPAEEAYIQLKEALVRYREYAWKGTWPQVPDGVKLQKNDVGERVIALRRRLEATSDLDKVETVQPDLFDTGLEEAVKGFQRRHGTDDDGVVGRGTLAALNVSAEDRVRQIELNMERWRWLPRDLGRRYILVNIAGFELEVIENDRLALEMRVVVGRPYRRTPVFSSHMTYLVFSPYWHVPANLAVQDIVPAVQKDPDYLTKKNIKVFRGWGVETQDIDPATIDWPNVDARSFPFRFRQEPGPGNSLGVIKFMFPNSFNVYLHDTPSRELFQKAERTFSSGCIRIAKPLELAEYVLKGTPGWSAENIQAAARKGVEQTVRLPEPIPVHLLYWTSWIDPEDNLQFRNDVYGRDRLLNEALGERPPTVH